MGRRSFIGAGAIAALTVAGAVGATIAGAAPPAADRPRRRGGLRATRRPRRHRALPRSRGGLEGARVGAGAHPCAARPARAGPPEVPRRRRPFPAGRGRGSPRVGRGPPAGGPGADGRDDGDHGQGGRLTGPRVRRAPSRRLRRLVRHEQHGQGGGQASGRETERLLPGARRQRPADDHPAGSERSELLGQGPARQPGLAARRAAPRRRTRRASPAPRRRRRRR